VPNSPANPNIQETKTPTSYRGEDCNDNRFFIEGSLRPGGIPSFLVVAELLDGTRRTVSGSEFFDAMMDAFGAAAVAVIEGAWSTANPDWITNLVAFNGAVLQGDTEAVAAPRTPTGKYATRKGYTKVTVVHALPAGARGRYDDVLVRFTK
jgi:hypothetical protein